MTTVALRATVQGDIGIGAPVYSQSFETGTDSWLGNTAFGTLDLPASIVQSTVTPDDGSYALRTTWADGSDSKPQWVGRDFHTFSWWQVGQTLTMVARLRISSAAQQIRPNYIFHQVDDVIVDFPVGEWFTYAFTFTAGTNGAFVGFENISPVAGDYIDIDRIEIFVGTATDYPVDYRAGDACPILVDGADTPVTANGLPGYTPAPGDRLLVSKVGGQVEILQFLSRSVATDGAAPSYSPDPKVSGGLTNLQVSWSAISNADPVTYEVHVSDAAFTAIPGDSTTLAGTTPGTSFYVYTLPRTGNALAGGVDYFVQIIATDADGAASPGGQVSARLSTSAIVEAVTLNLSIAPPSTAPFTEYLPDPTPVAYAANNPSYPLFGLGYAPVSTSTSEFLSARHYPAANVAEIQVYRLNKVTSGSNAVYYGGFSLLSPNVNGVCSFHATDNKFGLITDGQNGFYYVYWGATSSLPSGTNISYTTWGSTSQWNIPTVFYNDADGMFYTAAVNKADGKLYIQSWPAAATAPAGGDDFNGISTNVYAGTFVFPNDATRNLRGLYVGAGDYTDAVQRFVVQTETNTYVLRKSDGAHLDTEDWTRAPGEANSGLGWDGNRFWAISRDTSSLRKQSQIQAAWPFEATYTWYNSGAGTESTPSPAASKTIQPRYWLHVSTSNVPSASGSGVPDSVRVYYNTPTDSVPNLQSALSPGTTTYTSEQVITAAHAPATDGFAALGGGGSIVSEALDGSSKPYIQINGDGSGRMGPFSWDNTGANLNDSGWITPTPYGGSWVGAGGSWEGSAGYRKINGIVYLKGVLINGTVGQAPFFLPAGYRPLKDRGFYTGAPNGTTQTRTHIRASDGAVYIDVGGTNGGWFLDGINFPAEA